MVSVDVKHHVYLLVTTLDRVYLGFLEREPCAIFSLRALIHATNDEDDDDDDDDDDDELMLNVLRCHLTY